MVEFAILVLALAAPQEKPFSADDVLKLWKAGIGENVILTKVEQEKASLSPFSDEDFERLKEAGVPEKIIARLKEVAPKPPPPPKAPPKEKEKAPEPDRGKGKGVALRNLSHRAVKVSINAEDRIIDFSTKHGTDLSQGGSLQMDAAPGEYTIAIEGWTTTEGVRVPETGSCALTVRGADTEYLDVQTIVAEDSEGRRVVILHNQGKLTPGQMPRHEESYAPTVFYGPEYSYYPYVLDSVCASVGVGAFVGYSYYGGNHCKSGSWYGSIGLFIGCGGWRW